MIFVIFFVYLGTLGASKLYEHSIFNFTSFDLSDLGEYPVYWHFLFIIGVCCNF